MRSRGWSFFPLRTAGPSSEEFSRVVAAAAELDSYAPVVQLAREWRATAEVHADPKLARRLRRPLQAVGDRIERPAG